MLQLCYEKINVKKEVEEMFSLEDKCCADGTKLKSGTKKIKIQSELQKRVFVLKSRAVRWSRKGLYFRVLSFISIWTLQAQIQHT